MLKDLLKEGGLYTIANLLTKGISLLLIPFYTAYFSPEDYGVIDMITVFGFFYVAVVTLQLSQGLGRYVADPKLDVSDKIKIASTGIWFAVFLLVVFTLYFIFFPNYTIRLLSNEVIIPQKTFIIAVISIGINGIFYFLGVYLRFLRKTKQFAFLSLIHALGSVLLVMFFVIYLDKGIDSIYISFIIIIPPLILSQLYILRNHIKFVFDLSQLKKLLFYSLPLIPGAIAFVLMNFIDRIFIKEYLNFTELGIYGIASKFASFIAVILTGFNMAISPIIFEKHDDKRTQVELEKIFKYFISIGTITTLALSIFSRETLLIFTNYKYHGAESVMPFMYYTALLTGLSMFSLGMAIEKKTIKIAIIMLFFSILNFVLNYFLIPNYGIMGAAFSTLISIGLYQIVYLIFSFKHFYFKINIIKVLLIALMNIIILIGINYLNIETPIYLILIKIFLVALYVFFIFKLKLMPLFK